MPKFAISMPDSVLAEVEKARKKTGESRSQFLRRAAESYIRREQEKEWDRQYVEAYRKYPETDEEKAFVGAALSLAPQEGPWSEPWEESDSDA